MQVVFHRFAVDHGLIPECGGVLNFGDSTIADLICSANVLVALRRLCT
jgi:hypothetical protein